MSELEISKPFAQWKNFGACVLAQQKIGHSKKSAGAICHKIQERAEKGMLYKTADLGSLEVLKGTGNDLIVGGPASWDIIDPANDWVTSKGHQKFMEKLFKLPKEFQNVSIDHTSLIIGKPLLQYPEKNPRYFSHVHEKAPYLISKIRDDDMGYTQEYRKKILNKEYKMYSIRGKALNPQFIQKNGSLVRKVDDIDPIEVAIVKEGMCPMPEIEVLKEKTMMDVSKMSIDELKAKLLSLYGERSKYDRLLYPPAIVASEQAMPIGISDSNEIKTQVVIPDELRAELENKLSVLRIEIYGLEDVLRKKVADTYKTKINTSNSEEIGLPLEWARIENKYFPGRG